jgi:hypothetical protein
MVDIGPFTMGEEHYFRDGLWVSAWFAGGTGTYDSAYMDSIYNTIWK